MGGKTGKKERSLRQQTPFERLGSSALRGFGLFCCCGPRRWFWLGLRGRLLDGLRFLFRGKLRFDLLGNSVGVHFVMQGGVFERFAGLRLRPG